MTMTLTDASTEIMRLADGEMAKTGKSRDEAVRLVIANPIHRELVQIYNGQPLTFTETAKEVAKPGSRYDGLSLNELSHRVQLAKIEQATGRHADFGDAVRAVLAADQQLAAAYLRT